MGNPDASLLVFRSITALPFGVGMATSPAGLIAVTGSTDGGASGLIGTLCGAVAVTSVAVAANDHRGTATRTQIASSGFPWAIGPWRKTAAPAS